MNEDLKNTELDEQKIDDYASDTMPDEDDPSDEELKGIIDAVNDTNNDDTDDNSTSASTSTGPDFTEIEKLINNKLFILIYH